MTDVVFQQAWLPKFLLEPMRGLIRSLYKSLARIEVSGWENLPASGGFVVSNNHLSALDTPLMFSLLQGRKVTAFVADNYRRNLLTMPVISMIDVIWVHRGSIGPSTLKYAIKALRGGSVVGVNPEGTRSRTGAMGPGKEGAAFLASAAGVPLVPVAIDNPEKIFRSLLRFRRQRVTVTVGKPLTPPSGRPEPAILEQFTTEIMCQLAAMLPPERRGLYADHPRTVELLAANAAGNSR